MACAPSLSPCATPVSSDLMRGISHSAEVLTFLQHTWVSSASIRTPLILQITDWSPPICVPPSFFFGASSPSFGSLSAGTMNSSPSAGVCPFAVHPLSMWSPISSVYTLIIHRKQSMIGRSSPCSSEGGNNHLSDSVHVTGNDRVSTLFASPSTRSASIMSLSNANSASFCACHRFCSSEHCCCAHSTSPRWRDRAATAPRTHRSNSAAASSQAPASSEGDRRSNGERRCRFVFTGGIAFSSP